MPFLSSSEMAFARPSPSRFVHGGVARNTRDAILLCEAAGYRNILIEAVGVGQSEAAVREMVDVLILVTIPGAADELQGIKRGVMESVDLVVVNKADGDYLTAAERARRGAESAIHFLPASASGWRPRANRMLRSNRPRRSRPLVNYDVRREARLNLKEVTIVDHARDDGANVIRHLGIRWWH